MQQAFQTLNSSFLSATAALRQTASATAGPTQAGLTAYNSAIASAITTLNSSISTALGNLTNTGAHPDLDDQGLHRDPPDRVAERRQRPGQLHQPGGAVAETGG